MFFNYYNRSLRYSIVILSILIIRINFCIYCRIRVEFLPGNGKKQDIWSKEWKEISSGYNDKIYPITDKIIEKLETPYINSLSIEENKKLNEYHKTLLREARDENNSMEVAYKLNSLFDDPIKILGSRTELDLGRYETVFVLHNHPNNESFSDKDLLYFLSNKKVKYISIVKHNGNIEILEKTDAFDLRKAIIEFKRSESKNSFNFANDVQKRYNLIVKNFLKKHKKTGINYIRR